MTEYCAANKTHKCIKWQDYEMTFHELEEADELCHGIWIEIQKSHKYICNYRIFSKRMALHIHQKNN